MVKDKKLNIKIHDTYPLKDVARAHTVSFGGALNFDAAKAYQNG